MMTSQYNRFKRNFVKTMGLWFPFEVGKRTLVRSYVAQVIGNSGASINTCVIVNRAGINFELDLEVEIDLWIYLTGWWEKIDCKIALSSLKKGDVVIDVGANMGFYSLHAAKIVGPNGCVYAFEPNLKTLSKLKKNVELNFLNNIVSTEFALSDYLGEADLFQLSESKAGDSSLHALYHNSSNMKIFSSEVRVISLDMYCNENNLDRIDFIKIDAEGSEPTVLIGAQNIINTYKPRMLVECNEKALNAAGWDGRDFLYLIRDLGYQIYKRRRWGTSLKPVSSHSDIGEICNLYCIPLS